jgi:hypothetical protein
MAFHAVHPDSVAPRRLSGAGHRLPWANETPAVGSKSLRGPRSCRFDRQIVQHPCMPKERLPSRVFSAEIFSQPGVI